MDCQRFQKVIPEILKGNIPDAESMKVIEHIENCPDCYEEMEIYYVLQYGLNDSDNKESMNFVGRLDNEITRIKTKTRRRELISSITGSLFIICNCVAFLAAIYVLFMFF